MEVVPPLVGDDKPSVVRAEITLDVSRLADNIRREWESLRPDDVIFLLAIQAPDDSKMGTNPASRRARDILRFRGICG